MPSAELCIWSLLCSPGGLAPPRPPLSCSLGEAWLIGWLLARGPAAQSHALWATSCATCASHLRAGRARRLRLCVWLVCAANRLRHRMRICICMGGYAYARVNWEGTEPARAPSYRGRGWRCRGGGCGDDCGSGGVCGGAASWYDASPLSAIHVRWSKGALHHVWHTRTWVSHH